jgi:hypothetical protein
MHGLQPRECAYILSSAHLLLQPLLRLLQQGSQAIDTAQQNCALLVAAAALLFHQAEPIFHSLPTLFKFS